MESQWSGCFRVRVTRLHSVSLLASVGVGMNKEKTMTASSSFLHDLFQIGVYKRSQGRIVRQATFAALFLVVLLGAWRVSTLFDTNRDASWYLFSSIEYIVPAIILFAGLWLSYRVVNYPPFADFLISVEAEMNKVSWPSKTELIRNSMVVIFLMFFLAFLLYGFDLAWQILFTSIGVLYRPESTGTES